MGTWLAHGNYYPDNAGLVMDINRSSPLILSGLIRLLMRMGKAEPTGR